MIFNEHVEIRSIVIEKLLCDTCGTEMQLDPVVLTTFPPQYQYKCPKCQITIINDKVYPKCRAILSNGEDLWLK